MSEINNNEFANIDGDLVNYEIEYGEGRVNPNSVEGFMSNADGDYDNADGDDEYYDADGDYDNADGDEDFYNARGLFKNFRKNQAKRQKRRDDRTKSKNEARSQKAKAKQTQAEAQIESAKAMAKGTEGDLALAKSLEAKPDTTPVKEGLSKTAKIGIAVGVVVVLGIVGFIVYKKMSAGKGAGKGK
jgi:hypothetical protein